MATPVVVVASGGLPVVEATNGLGLPMTVASNGFGMPVTIATNGYGLPVVATGLFIDDGRPANTLPPYIDDPSPTVGEIINVTQGSWTHSPTGFAYQWYRTTYG